MGFSRRALCETTAQSLALADKLDPTPIGGIFGITNDKVRPLPISQLQDDLQYSNCEQPPEGHDFMGEEAVFHPFKGFTRARAVHVERPSTLDREEFELLRPQDRVENLQFVKQSNMARKMLRKAMLDRRRLVHLMQQQHPNGVCGLDTPANLESEVYEAQARSIAERDQRLERLAEFRKQRLFELSTSFAEPDSSVISHSADAEVSGRLACRKHPGVQEYNPQFANTHDRVFYQRKQPRNIARQQRMVNTGTNGRKFDIITGAMLPSSRRPTIPEKVDKRQHHPSNMHMACSHA